jgi:PAS domain-containing protein
MKSMGVLPRARGVMRERLMPRPTVDGGRDRQVASESQDRFRAVIEALPDPFAIHSAVRDETGRIVDFRFEYVNAATVAFNGLSAEAQVGHRLLELFPALLGSALFDAFVRVVETGEPLAMESVGYVDAAAAGGPIRSVLDVRAVKFGDGYAVASRDLTARARARRAGAPRERGIAPCLLRQPRCDALDRRSRRRAHRARRR